MLDRFGGRTLLGSIATLYFRRISGHDLEITHLNGLWTRRVGGYFFPDGPRFEYTYSDFSNWKNQAESYLSEAQDYWLRHYTPQAGDVIVDIGAGRGEDTLAFARAVGAAGRVIAIEADSQSFVILKAFCKLNGLANVTPVHLALMDQPGSVRMVRSSSSWKEGAVERADGAEVDAVQAGRFADLCSREGIGAIAFLKMNIEGAERYALLGMGSVVARVQQICVACHDFRSELGHGEQYRTRSFVEEFLVSHGFTLSSRSDDPRDYVRDHIFGQKLKKSL